MAYLPAVSLPVHCSSCDTHSPHQLVQHPIGEPCDDNYITDLRKDAPDNVMFDEIDEHVISKTAKRLSGSGGPSGLNADGLKRMLCSKSFKKVSSKFCYNLALIA